MEFSSFPKNLVYKISQLQGISKTSVKLTPDRTTVSSGETFRVKMPSNTLIDLRTFTLHAKGTATQDSGSDKLHFPRNGLSSCIKTLGLYVNGTLIERIDNYNILYNKLYDLDAGSDQDAKRGVLENADPSIGYSFAPTGGATDYSGGDPVIRVNNNATADTNLKMMVNNWLGFISSASTPVVDTNDLNSVEVEITLSDANVLWSSADGTASTAPTTTGANYSLNDIHFTISKMIFNDSLYYNLKASKLLSSGLNIGYSTYISSKLSTTAKGTSMNMMTTVNSTSLDQLICCFNPATPTITTLRLQGANNVNAGKTFKEAIATQPVATSSGDLFHNSAGGLFNQSYYFQSDATNLVSSSVEINNTPLMPQPLDDSEIYNESLIAMGNNNIDMSAGVHQGCKSLADFLKYYFAMVVSLENISGEKEFVKSGLDGKSSALNINWKASFNVGSSPASVAPYIFAKCSRVLTIMEGHSVVVSV